MRKTFAGLGTLLLLALAYALDTDGLFPVFLAAAVFHELGHAAAILCCGGRIRGFSPAPFGFSMRFDGLLSYRKDALIALGGPAANLLAAFLSAAAARASVRPAGYHVFAGVNLLLGLFNLLPAEPLDGGRVLSALLALRFDDRTAHRAVRAVTRLLGAALTALGVYILAKTRYNMSILAVGSLILGGTYAEGAGKNLTARAQARKIRGRRVRAGSQG